MDDNSQLGLIQIAVWCIGEYGDALVRLCNGMDDEPSFPPVSESDILSLLDKCLRLHNSDVLTKSLVINSLLKLSVRFSAESKNRISDLISPYRSSMSLELQQRSSEFSLLLTSRWDSIRGKLLAKMPVLDEVPCCALLCHSLLCCAMLYCAVLCCTLPFHGMVWTVLRCTLLFCTVSLLFCSAKSHS